MNLTQADKRVLNNLQIPYDLRNTETRELLQISGLTKQEFKRWLKEEAVNNRQLILKQDKSSVKNREAQRRFKAKQLRIRELGEPIEIRTTDFIEQIGELSAIAGINPKNAFIITVIDFKTGAMREMTFNWFGHFEAFWDKIMKNDDGTFEENKMFYKAFHDPNVEKEAFKFGYGKIRKVEGGYQNHTHNDNYEISLPLYDLITVNPKSCKNNCGIQCINYLLNQKLIRIRKKFGLKDNEMIQANILLQMYNQINNGEKKPLIIITDTYDEEFDFNTYNYILLYKNHYVVVKTVKKYKEIEEGSLNDKRTKRGNLTFDFETRPLLSGGIKIKKILKDAYGDVIYDTNNKPKTYYEYEYPLYDTLCCIEYNDNRMTEKHHKAFVGYYHNDKYVSSAYQFVKWLQVQSNKGKCYNCVAHNGSRFDMYLLTKAVAEIDITCVEKVQFRGLSIIGMQLFSHLFKDSCCFLTNSLSNLSKNFKVETAKITSFVLDGNTITNEQLCFYKPELDVKEFLELRHKEPEYWKLYEEYCYADCSALSQIWKKFTECADSLIAKMNSRLLAKCRVNSCNTIGSHAKKILTTLIDGAKYNKIGELNWNWNKAFNLYKLFFMHHKLKIIDSEKLNFIKKFKRGGISHCNKAGKHTKGIVSVDITSQYPTAMMYMLVPSGKSEFIDYYDISKYGYYHIKNVVYENNDFKPASGSRINNNSLNWSSECHTEDYLDSFMIKYLQDNHGLKSFDVVRGLVSNSFVEGKDIFGRYVMTLFEAKAEQDVFKKNNDVRYNPALREVIKLYLNSLSGKLVEDPRKYGSITIKTLDEDNVLKKANHVKEFNGSNAIKKVSDEDNILVGLGCMVYSYSKRLLFEYINLLPEKSNSVIATETDSIYFPKSEFEILEENCKNYKGEYPVCFGNELGNIKIEKNTDDVCYFLGKKFYYIDGNYIIKGIPKHTIDDSGNKIELVDKQLYEDIYNWKKGDELIQRTFKTIKKCLYGKTELYSTNITRTIMPNMKYKEY